VIPDYIADRPEYRADQPVTPAWDGSRIIDGVEIVTGSGAADAVDRLLARGQRLGMDTETTGTEAKQRRQVRCVTFGHAGGGHAPLGVCLDPRDPKQRALIVRVIREAPGLYLHNAAFDAPAIFESGIYTEMDWLGRIYDTMVLARIVRRWKIGEYELRGASLEDSLFHYMRLGADPDTKPLDTVAKIYGFTSKKSWYEQADIDIAAYIVGAVSDVVWLPQLAVTMYEQALDRLTRNDIMENVVMCTRDEAVRLVDREQTVNLVMLRANMRGFEVDTEYGERYLAFARERLTELVPDLLELGWVTDPRPEEPEPWVRYSADGDAVTRALIVEGVIDPKAWPRTPRGGLSAKAVHLRPVCDPETGKPDARVGKFVEFKEIQKIAKDYVAKMLDSMHVDGRVRPSTQVLAAVTGRMSYNTPPLQQFSDPARRVVVADKWASIDWTAVEPVTAAALAGQWDYVAKIEAGSDPYIPIGRDAGLIPDDIPDFPPEGMPEKEAEAFDCAKNHKGRKQAKVILLGLMYGEGIKSLSASLGMTIPEAKALQNRVFEVIPLVQQYLDGRAAFTDRNGFVLSASGRFLATTRDKGDGAWRGYLGQNYTCQGSAYDVLAEAIYEAERRGLGDNIHLAMHDELIVDDAHRAEFEGIMQSAMRTLARVAPEAANHRFVTDAHPLETCWKKV